MAPRIEELCVNRKQAVVAWISKEKAANRGDDVSKVEEVDGAKESKSRDRNLDEGEAAAWFQKSPDLASKAHDLVLRERL